MKEKYKYQNARILSKKNLKVVRKVKKMTRQFFLLLTMILLASGSNFAQQETQKSISNEVDVLPESKDVYGTYVGSFNGVNAYSNGYNDYVSNVYNYETGINTGMKWQCVEYVNRYHYETYGTNIRVAGHNAEDYYSNASQHGLTAFANGGSEAPKVGDILCSNADPWGHVAIIREVSSSSITVIHQNWANSSIDNAKVISRSGNYISGFNASYSVQGWLRNSNSESFAANYSNQASFPTVAPGETNNWWVEFENTGTETWYNTGSNRIRLGSGTFSNPDQLFDITNSSWNSSYRPTDLDQSNINPGGIGRFTFSFTVPSNAQAGWSQEYHFTPLVESVEWMKQDDGQEINCFMKYYVEDGVTGLPDYVVSQYEVVSGLGTYQQGEDISLECTVSNVGDGDADHGIHVGYYLSQSPDGTDYYLEDDYCGRLDVGEDTEEDVIVAIPSNVPDGDYYVVFYANNEDEDPESNYNNNIESIGGITIGGIPQISLSTTIHDFGNITENDCSSVYNFTLTNTGTATANGSISLTGGNSSHFEITTGGGIFNLPAGQNRTIGVRFCPDNPGYKYATLDVNGTAPCNDVQATVEGIGIAIPDPVISVAPSTLDFEEVIIGESLTKNYLLTGSNLTANVTILAPSGYQVSLSSSSGFSTAIVAYQSGGNISETIYVKFSPTSAQSYNGNVSNSSAGAATKNVQLTGIGIPEPEIPTVSILSPEEGQTIPMQYIDVSGTANDADGTVTQVQIRLNSGIWQTVSGTTTWSMVDAGPLVVGSNTIEARSKDNDSQYSEISEVTFTHNDVCAPDWEPATSQQYNMQVIAQLYIDDVLSTNSNDMLGAFVDGECRGTASPIVGNPNGLIFLTITSNISEGEIVTFKGWNSDICEECSLFETITFVNQDEIGTIPNPEPFHCGLIDFCLDFEDGYTWFSVNVNPGSFEWNSLFEGLSPCNNDRIIGQGGFASYSDGQWYYSPVIFPELLPNKMYIMKLCNSQQWCIQGQQVAIEPIDLSSGWTWLGYLPQEELAINEAIGIDPAPANDDRFVGQNAFSAYYGTQWIGQLMQLNIGEGYKIKLTNEGTLSYPGSLTKNVGGENATKVFNPLQVPYKSNKKYSMNIIAKLLLPDGSYSTNPFDAIYAFHENECCGIASPIENSDGLYMLSIGSNFDQGEEIDLIAYDDFSQEVSKIEETIVFNTYTEAGTVNNPVEYTVSGVSTNINFGDKHQSTTSLEAFPNPFDHEMKIHLSLEFSGQVQAYIKNVHGQKVLQLEDATMLRAGNHTYDIHETNLNPGVYYCIFEITTTSGKHLETMKIIKL